MKTAQKIFEFIYSLEMEDFYLDNGYYDAEALASEYNGLCIYEANEGQSSKSYAPTTEWEFEDGSILQIGYSGLTILK
jgi:hypothetical protein